MNYVLQDSPKRLASFFIQSHPGCDYNAVIDYIVGSHDTFSRRNNLISKAYKMKQENQTVKEFVRAIDALAVQIGNFGDDQKKVILINGVIPFSIY